MKSSRNPRIITVLRQETVSATRGREIPDKAAKAGKKTGKSPAAARLRARYRLFRFPGHLDSGRDVLALGADASNTVCLVKGADAFLSPLVGNLADTQAYDAFRLEIDRLKKLTRAKPAVVAHDMNPNLLASKFARELGPVRLVPVQHHFAHVASCLAQHGETDSVLGIVYDEGGYGDDGTIWGAEFLLATPAGYERLGHLRPVRWPGGERALREPWRIALAFMHLAYGYHTRAMAYDLFKAVPRGRIDMLYGMLDKGVHFPRGSSLGAFLRALGAIIGASTGTDPSRAAAELESLASKSRGKAPVQPYPYDILDDGNLVLVDPARTFYSVVENALAGIPGQEIAKRSFETVVAFTLEVCRRLRRRVRTDKVVLTGAMFECEYLLKRTTAAMKNEGFNLLTHTAVSPGDAGISLGQAYAARARQGSEKG